MIGPGGVLAQGAAGRRRIDRPDAATVEDNWHIGSNTKAMTAALFAKLAEQGKLAWGAKLPALFPELTPDLGWGPVSIDDVLAHRSGISDAGIVTPLALRDWQLDPRPVREQRAALAARLITSRPNGRPGVFDYANLNYILAGAIIERATGRAWEDVISAELFQPLEMHTAGFGAPRGAAPWGHAANARGQLEPVDPAGVADNPPIFGPAGRVNVTIDDYAKFLQLFLADGAGFLKPASLARLGRPWRGEADAYAPGGWLTFAERAWAQGPVLAHEGSNTLWHCIALVAPVRQRAIVVMANSEKGGAELCQRLSIQLVQQYAPAPPPPAA